MRISVSVFLDYTCVRYDLGKESRAQRRVGTFARWQPDDKNGITVCRWQVKPINPLDVTTIKPTAPAAPTVVRNGYPIQRYGEFREGAVPRLYLAPKHPGAYPVIGKAVPLGNFMKDDWTMYGSVMVGL